jgi:hypothetical protein
VRISSVRVDDGVVSCGVVSGAASSVALRFGVLVELRFLIAMR